MERVRLPLAGELREELPPVSDALRAPLALPCIALVSAGGGDALESGLVALREALHEALRSAQGESSELAELHAVLRTREGAELALPKVNASLLAMPAALLEAEAALAAGRPRVLLATGVALVAIRAPSLAILVTSGRSILDWSPDVRSVRHRFDLIVPELDRVLARELAERFVARLAA